VCEREGGIEKEERHKKKIKPKAEESECSFFNALLPSFPCTHIEGKLVGKDRIATRRLLWGRPHNRSAEGQADQDLGATDEPALVVC